MSWIWCIDISIINKIWCFFKYHCTLISNIIRRCPARKIIIHNIFLCNAVISHNSCNSLRHINCCSICVNRIIFFIVCFFWFVTRHIKPSFIFYVTAIYLSIKECYSRILSPRSSKISRIYLKFIVSCYCTVSKHIPCLSCCCWLVCCNITANRACTITKESKLTSVKYCIAITKYVICITFYATVLKIHISCRITCI